MSKTKTVLQGAALTFASALIFPGFSALLAAAVLALVWWLAGPLPLAAYVVAGVFAVVPPLLPVVAVLCATWDDTPTTGSWGTDPTIRGDVPRWLRWLQTPDERLPGGLYEPTVADLLARRGRLLCAWYWIGLRNRAHGLRRMVGQPSTADAFAAKFPVVDGKADGVRSDGTWYRERHLGPFKIVTGFRIYQDPGPSYSAVPTATIKGA